MLINLEWIKILKTLNKEEKEKLSTLCQSRTLESNDILFNEWDKANALYIVLKWELEAFKDNKILGNISEWWIIWEMASFSDTKKRTATIRVVRATNLLVISSFAIDNIYKDHKEIYNKIRKIVTNRKENNKK